MAHVAPTCPRLGTGISSLISHKIVFSVSKVNVYHRYAFTDLKFSFLLIQYSNGTAIEADINGLLSTVL